MPDSTQGLARLLLVLAYAGGAVLVLLLLSKDHADALALRTVFTALGVITFGLIGVAGLRLLERSGLDSLWGYATVLIAATAFVLLMVEIWSEGNVRNETRLEVMIVISILLGGGSLVLGGEEEGEDRAIQTTRLVALLALLAFGLFTVLSVADVHIGPRWFGVAAAVFLVSALSLPLLRLTLEDRAN